MTKLAGGCPGGYGSAEDEKSSGGGVTLQKRMTKLAGGCPGYGSGDDETDGANHNNKSMVSESKTAMTLNDMEEKEEVSKLISILT